MSQRCVSLAEISLHRRGLCEAEKSLQHRSLSTSHTEISLRPRDISTSQRSLYVAEISLRRRDLSTSQRWFSLAEISLIRRDRCEADISLRHIYIYRERTLCRRDVSASQTSLCIAEISARLKSPYNIDPCGTNYVCAWLVPCTNIV